MKVGLLDTLGSRYLRFWEPYLRDLNVQVTRPTLPKHEAYALGRASLADEPPHVQLALGRILELAEADAILVPHLNGIEGDPWGDAFTDVLSRRVSSLPALVTAPETGEAAARAAAEVGARLTHNPGLVRRALDRNRPMLTPPRASMPSLTAAGKHTVALIGPEALLAEPYLLGDLMLVLGQAVHVVPSGSLPRDAVLERGLRAGAGTPGERELAGAQGVLEGKSAVRGLVFAVPARSGAYRRVAERLATKAHKPAIVVDIEPDRTDWAELRGFIDRVTLGVTTRSSGGNA